MKTTHKYLLIASLISLAVSAQARDLGPDEALKLRDSGTIQSAKLSWKTNGAAMFINWK
jgi:hypothetical protein